MTFRFRRLLLLSLTAATFPTAALTAAGQGGKAELADKLTALKESIAQNQQRLHRYQWTETTQLTLKGEPKPAKQYLCQYGPDGQVQKTPIASEGMQPSQGGRFKQKMVKKKTAEVQDYMGQVKELLSVYVPPDPAKLQQSHQAGNASIGKGGRAGERASGFSELRQAGRLPDHRVQWPGKKDSSLNVKTYMQQPSDAVTLDTRFASLPDGTNYPQESALNMAAKQMVVTTTNSNYQKLQ
jgi:hypothetical protein